MEGGALTVPATQLGHTLDRTQADRDTLAYTVSLVLGKQRGQSNHVDYGVGSLLLGTTDALKEITQ